jgi:hypothetical protein
MLSPPAAPEELAPGFPANDGYGADAFAGLLEESGDESSDEDEARKRRQQDELSVEEVRQAAEAEGIVVSAVDKDADDALARKVADMLAEIAATSVLDDDAVPVHRKHNGSRAGGRHPAGKAGLRVARNAARREAEPDALAGIVLPQLGVPGLGWTAPQVAAHHGAPQAEPDEPASSDDDEWMLSPGSKEARAVSSSSAGAPNGCLDAGQMFSSMAEFDAHVRAHCMSTGRSALLAAKRGSTTNRMYFCSHTAAALRRGAMGSAAAGARGGQAMAWAEAALLGSACPFVALAQQATGRFNTTYLQGMLLPSGQYHRQATAAGARLATTTAVPGADHHSWVCTVLIEHDCAPDVSPHDSGDEDVPGLSVASQGSGLSIASQGNHGKQVARARASLHNFRSLALYLRRTSVVRALPRQLAPVPPRRPSPSSKGPALAPFPAFHSCSVPVLQVPPSEWTIDIVKHLADAVDPNLSSMSARRIIDFIRGNGRSFDGMKSVQHLQVLLLFLPSLPFPSLLG